MTRTYRIPFLYAASILPPICSVSALAMESPSPVESGRGGLYRVKPVKQAAGLNFVQMGSMVGENDLTAFSESYLQVAVAVFYGIADEIAEDPGTGAPVKHTADLCVREADPGRDMVLFQYRIVCGYAFFQKPI